MTKQAAGAQSLSSASDLLTTPRFGGEMKWHTLTGAPTGGGVVVVVTTFSTPAGSLSSAIPIHSVAASDRFRIPSDMCTRRQRLGASHLSVAILSHRSPSANSESALLFLIRCLSVWDSTATALSPDIYIYIDSDSAPEFRGKSTLVIQSVGN